MTKPWSASEGCSDLGFSLYTSFAGSFGGMCSFGPILNEFLPPLRGDVQVLQDTETVFTPRFKPVPAQLLDTGHY